MQSRFFSSNLDAQKYKPRRTQFRLASGADPGSHLPLLRSKEKPETDKTRAWDGQVQAPKRRRLETASSITIHLHHPKLKWTLHTEQEVKGVVSPPLAKLTHWRNCLQEKPVAPRFPHMCQGSQESHSLDTIIIKMMYVSNTLDFNYM